MCGGRREIDIEVEFRKILGDFVNYSDTYPERDHGWEVERSHSRTDPQWLPVGIGVHVSGETTQCLSLLKASNGATVFHHLNTTQHFTLSIWQCLPLLLSNGVTQFILQRYMQGIV